MSSRKRKTKGSKQGQGGGLKQGQGGGLKLKRGKVKPAEKCAPITTPPASRSHPPTPPASRSHPPTPQSTRPHPPAHPRLLLVSPSVAPSQESPMHLTVSYDYHHSFDGDWEGPAKSMEELAGLFQFKDSPGHAQGRPLPPLLWHDLGSSPSLPPKKKPRSNSSGSQTAGFQRLERLASELQDCLGTDLEEHAQGRDTLPDCRTQPLPDCRTQLQQLLEEERTASVPAGDQGDSPQHSRTLQEGKSPQNYEYHEDNALLDVLFECEGADGVEEREGVEEGGGDSGEERGGESVEEGRGYSVEEGGSTCRKEDSDDGGFWSMAAEVVESSSWNSQRQRQQGSEVKSVQGEAFGSEEADVFIEQLLWSELATEGSSGRHSSPEVSRSRPARLSQPHTRGGSSHMTRGPHHMNPGLGHMTNRPSHMNPGLGHMTREANHMTNRPSHMNPGLGHMTNGPNHIDSVSSHMTSGPYHLDGGSSHMTGGPNPTNESLSNVGLQNRADGPSQNSTSQNSTCQRPAGHELHSHCQNTPEEWSGGRRCASKGTAVLVGGRAVVESVGAQHCCSQAEIAVKRERAKLRRSRRLRAPVSSATATGGSSS